MVDSYYLTESELRSLRFAIWCTGTMIALSLLLAA